MAYHLLDRTRRSGQMSRWVENTSDPTARGPWWTEMGESSCPPTASYVTLIQATAERPGDVGRAPAWAAWAPI